MVSFFSSALKIQSEPSLTPRKLPFFIWKILLPLVVLGLLFILDYPLRAFVQDQQSTFLTIFFDIIKYAGNVIVGFCLSFVLIGVGKFRGKDRLLRSGKLMLLSLIVANVVIIIAKPTLNIHPRNEMVSAEKQDSNAIRWGRFPSGDTTVAFTVATSLAAEFPPLLIPLYVVGFLVGVERVYFNLHFFSDVFAGAWLGIVVVTLLRKKYFLKHPSNSSCSAAPDNHS